MRAFISTRYYLHKQANRADSDLSANWHVGVEIERTPYLYITAVKKEDAGTVSDRWLPSHA